MKETSVVLAWGDPWGRQLVMSSRKCRPEEERASMDGMAVFSSSPSRWRSGMWGREGRQLRSSSDWFLSEWKSTTLGIFLAVYIVKARKMKNPIRCLKQ